MKLESINIAYFRCFESLKIGLAEDVTLIVGVNGAGKTAILDAIAIALFEVVVAVAGRNSSARKRHNALLKPTDIYLTPGRGQESERRNYTVNIRAVAKNFHQTPGFPRQLPFFDSQRLEWDSNVVFTPPASFIYPSSEDQSISQIHRYMQSLWEVFRQAPGALDPLPTIAYYRSNRKLKGDTPVGDIFNASYDRKAAYEDALDAGADFGAMYRWLYLAENQTLREKKNGTSSNRGVFVAMREALNFLINDVIEFGFQGMPPELVFEVVCRGVTCKQSLSQLSDGYRNLIGLCLDFARRMALANPNSAYPLTEPGILLIDEIELHLHPGWQQTVVPKLRKIFPNTQIIATTHSPQVLTSVEGKSIRILRNGQLFSAPPGTWGAESKQVLEEVLGIDSRPPAEFVPPVGEIEKLYRLIDEGKLIEAKSLVNKLLQEGRQGDADIIGAEISIDNRLWEEENQSEA